MRLRKGFTLIELLVVIAIIGVLAAMLAPVYVRVQTTSKSAVCASNMQQISKALMFYLDDNNGRFSHCDFKYGTNNAYTLGADDWGKWYWMFTCRQYMEKNKPQDYQSSAPGMNVYVCPSKPQYQKLIKTNQIYSLKLGKLDQKWGLTYQTLPGTSTKGYAIWCSYAINEHIPAKWYTYSEWERPTKSFMILESTDTEMTSDQLYYKYRYDHNGGSNIMYMDGHIEWRKAEYAGNPKSDKCIWKYPPGGSGRGLWSDVGEANGDYGPWTAPRRDDMKGL